METCNEENLSYLLPRAPSINGWDDRVKLSGPRTHNLLELGMGDSEFSANGKLKVFLRLKPCPVERNPYTVMNNTLQAEAPKESITYKNLTKSEGKLIHKFDFTSILNQDASQETIFKNCVLDNLKLFISGENFLLLAYGTTNAGKTFTIQGTVEEPGIIPRGMQFVFNSLRENVEASCQYEPCKYNELCLLDEDEIRKAIMYKNFILSLDLTKPQKNPDVNYRSFKSDTTTSRVISSQYTNETFREIESYLSDTKYDVSDDRYSIWISMVEIYNEQIYDLLEIPDKKGSRVKLIIAEDESGNVFVKNLRYINVSSGHEAFQVFQFGKANLHLAPTALNSKSSRSHCICTLTLARFLNYGNSAHAIISRFSFCDLAGVERVKKTLNVGHRLVESKSINTSLLIFTKCLTIIKENQSSREKKIVPYRESKLTRLFRDAMIGREKLSIIVNVTPEPNLFDETINVLKFSAIAQQIVPVNVYAASKRLLPVGKTRFSNIVSKASNTSKIIWDASTVIDVKVNDKNEAFQHLLDLVDRLKKELEDEKLRSANIEKEVREELTSKFSILIKKQYESKKHLFESEAQKMQDAFERKQQRLMDYFEKKQARAKEEDESNCRHLKFRIASMEKEIELLCSEKNLLRDQIQSISSDNNELQSRCTHLEFELSEKCRNLESLRINGSTEQELRDGFINQINEEKLKNEELKKLLDESAFEYRELLATNKSLKDENESLEKELATSSAIVEDLKNDVLDYERMLAAKTETIDQLESALEKVENENGLLAQRLSKQADEIKLLQAEINKNNSLSAEKQELELEKLLEEERKDGEKMKRLYDSEVTKLKKTDEVDSQRSERSASQLKARSRVGPITETGENIHYLESEVKANESFRGLEEERHGTFDSNYKEQQKQKKNRKLIKDTQCTEKCKSPPKENVEEETKPSELLSRQSDDEESKIVWKPGSESVLKDLEISLDQSWKIRSRDTSPEQLSREIEQLSFTSSRSKKHPEKQIDQVEVNLHPSTLKKSVKAGKSKKKSVRGKENAENETSRSSKLQFKKYPKKLFGDNDFDNISDLDTSFEEPKIRRLRRRKN